MVTVDGTCRCCRILVRLRQDDEWLWAEGERQWLPPGRPVQLALRLEGVRLPRADPLRHKDGPIVRPRNPRWSRPSWEEWAGREDDPTVCAEQVQSQLGLFVTPPRRFTVEHAQRIRGRQIPDLPKLIDELRAMATERGVGTTWIFQTTAMARLALSSRNPDEHLVRPETLPDLPQMHPTLREALDRAGLLAQARPRVVPAGTNGPGGCIYCLAAWADERREICEPCRNWAMDRPIGKCSRCHRTVPLRGGLCRFCLLVLAETEVDVDGTALDGADQLWFGDGFALHLRTTKGHEPGLYSKGRFQTKRRLAKAAGAAHRPVSENLAFPGQLDLFEMPRDWTRIDESALPILTSEARRVLADFVAHIRDRGWNLAQLSGSIRTLRIVVSHLGAAAPIREQDIREVTRLSSHHQGARVVNYLRLTGRLIPQPRTDTYVERARYFAGNLPPAFGDPVHTWINVMLGEGTRPSRRMASSTIYHHVLTACPVLADWARSGIDDLRSITRDDIEELYGTAKGHRAKTLQTALRSLFRALKRERLIFRDPARHISLSIPRSLPTPLSTDLLKGVLDTTPNPRIRLTIALVAIHALGREDQRRLLLDDLDRVRGRLTVRRPGRPDHTIYLDETTFALATDWIAERHRRWPTTTNPYLLVTQQTAADDTHPVVSDQAIDKHLRPLGLQIDRIRVDRILDEAKHTADPLHLIKLFGIAPVTAMKYIWTAHPASYGPDPIQP